MLQVLQPDSSLRQCQTFKNPPFSSLKILFSILYITNTLLTILGETSPPVSFSIILNIYTFCSVLQVLQHDYVFCHRVFILSLQAFFMQALPSHLASLPQLYSNLFIHSRRLSLCYLLKYIQYSYSA